MACSPASSLVPRGGLFYGSIASLCMVTFIVAVDAAIIGISLPTLAKVLNLTAIQASWAGSAFLLASTVLQPLFTAFSHIYGRLPILLLALVIFTVGSIIPPLATGAVLMLVGRTVQGAGAGGIQALCQVILSDLVPLRERGKWDAFLSLSWAIGVVLSPLVGGAFIDSDWRWVFWFNLPFCLIGFIAIPLTVRLQNVRDTNVRLGEFDWIGATIFTSSLTVLLVPLSWGGVMYNWVSYQTLVPLLLGLGGLTAFGFHTVITPRYRRCDPFLRPGLFTSLTGVSAYATQVIQWLILWTIVYYEPMYFQVAKDYTNVISGVAMLPYSLTIAPGAALTGFFVAKYGRYRLLLIVGWVLTVLGVGLLMTIHRDTSTPTWLFIYLTGGMGFGILTSAGRFAGQAYASNADLPFASGLNMFFRSLGQLLGVAVGGVAFQNALKDKFAANERFSRFADAWAEDASALVIFIKSLGPNEQEMKDVLIEGYVDGLRVVFLVMTVLGGVALVVALVGIKEISLEREHVPDQFLVRGGLVPAEKAVSPPVLVT